MTSKELDERLFHLFEDVGSSDSDWYDIHMMGGDVECIHLTPKARESVKQLIRDCIEAVSPVLGEADIELFTTPDHYTGFDIAIDVLNENTKELLGLK